MSTLVCGTADASKSPVGWLVFAVLVVLHLALLVAPMLLIAEFFSRLAGVTDGPVAAPGVLLAAMAVFCVASLGEIALHVQQNWVYLGLMPSWFNVVFYGALTLGQVR